MVVVQIFTLTTFASVCLSPCIYHDSHPHDFFFFFFFSFFFWIAFIHSSLLRLLSFLKKKRAKSGIDKLDEMVDDTSMCSFNKGNIEGINSLKFPV